MTVDLTQRRTDSEDVVKNGSVYFKDDLTGGQYLSESVCGDDEIRLLFL